MIGVAIFASSRSQRARALCLVCGLWLAASASVAKAQIFANNDSARAYYRLLDSLAALDVQSQIAGVRNYIEQRPGDERAYLKLWELSQQHDHGSEAARLFQIWAGLPRHRSHSRWMLAKTAARAGRRDTALVLFSQALRDHPSPSPALLYDYVQCGYEPSDPQNLQNLLQQSRLRAGDQMLVAAFHQYLHADYKAACATFYKLSARVQSEPLLLYLWLECLERNEQQPVETRSAQATAVCNRARERARKTGAREWQARFWAKRGDLAFNDDDLAFAQACYDSAYALAKLRNDSWGLQKAAAGRGKLQYMKGAYEEAAAHYQEAVTYAQILGADRDASLHYSNKSQPLYEIGKYAEALQACEQGMRHARKARDREGLIRIELQLAQLHHALRQHNYAKRICLEQAQNARAKFVKLSYRAEARLADILFDEENYTAADSLYDRYLDYLTRTNNDFERHNYISKKADILRAQKRHDDAIALYEKAAAAARDTAVQAYYYEAWYLLEIANLEAEQGKLDQAWRRLGTISQDALREKEEGLVQFNLSLGQVLQKRREWEGACAAYRKAAAGIDTSRQKLTLDQLRIGYFRERARPYQGLAECFFQLHHATGKSSYRDSLFKYLQLSRGRSFHDRTSGQETFSRDSVLTKNYLEARARLENLQARLRKNLRSDSSSHVELEALRYSVVYQQPGSSGGGQSAHNKIAPFIPSLAEAQEILRRLGSGLLLYHLSDEAAFVLALTGGDARVVPLHTTRAALDSMVKKLITPFHADTVAENNVARLPFHAGVAYALHQELIKPVQEKIALPERLVIVPDGVLTNLPFEMLLQQTPAREVYTPGELPEYAVHFLLHRHAFAYSPTLGMLLQEKRARFTPARTSVFANTQEALAVLPGAEGRLRIFEPLPFTALEAARIKERVAHAKIFTRTEATEAAFSRAAQESRVAHLASHAFIDSEFDAFSGLMLSENEGDGFLMGYEIAAMTLPCDLVALSACETGLGELAEGEGILGLPRLFLRAGAQSVLMTLWRVHDEFASELMPKFYDLYLNKGIAKAEALARAKRTLIRERQKNPQGLYYQHPFFWSAFTLYCDPGRNDKGFPSLIDGALFALAFILLSVAAYFVRTKIIRPSHAKRH